VMGGPPTRRLVEWATAQARCSRVKRLGRAPGGQGRPILIMAKEASGAGRVSVAYHHHGV
jgi:hypothetical protein